MFQRAVIFVFEGTGLKMKRLDLTDETIREKVAAIKTSAEQLRPLFVDAQTSNRTAATSAHCGDS
jgi:hypothetical protein